MTVRVEVFSGGKLLGTLEVCLKDYDFEEVVEAISSVSDTSVLAGDRFEFNISVRGAVVIGTVEDRVCDAPVMVVGRDGWVLDAVISEIFKTAMKNA